MLSWRNSPKVRMNMYTRHEISFREHLSWWSRVRDSSSDKYLMYEFHGQSLGVVGFNKIDHLSKNAFWAFYASPTAPKGTGSSMEFLALDYAFFELQLHKLSCEVLAFNSPVIKLHKKFMFSIEGNYRENHLHDKVYVDVVRLGILRREWLEVRDSIFELLWLGGLPTRKNGATQ